MGIGRQIFLEGLLQHGHASRRGAPARRVGGGLVQNLPRQTPRPAGRYLAMVTQNDSLVRGLRTGANVSRREYGGSRFDNTFVSGHAGPRWLVDRNTEASVLASVQRRWSASAPDYDSLGGRIEAGHRFSRRVTANARASWHDRRYRTRTFLDGPVADVSLSGTLVVTPTVRANAALGWGRERPETERWRHDRSWLRAGATVALPRGFTVAGSGELRWADYQGNWFPHTTGGEPREDRTRSLRVSVHNRAFSWQGFSPQVSLVHEVRTTNAQLYDYKRTGGELRFVRLF